MSGDVNHNQEKNSAGITSFMPPAVHIAAVTLSRAYPFGMRKLVTQRPDCPERTPQMHNAHTHRTHKPDEGISRRVSQLRIHAMAAIRMCSSRSRPFPLEVPRIL
jgi:hypothetical protein